MTDDSIQKLKVLFGEFDRTRKSYDTMSALNTLAQYWIENEIIIERAAKEEAEVNGPKWTPDWDDRDSIGEWHAERDIAREMHDRTMIPMHRYSCIVMLYSTVERELLRLVKNLEKERGSQKLKWKDIRANSKVEQISKYCEVFFGVRLVDCSQYNALTELQKIRDCIIHCLGEVGLSSDKEFLVSLSDKRRGFFAHLETCIQIEDECIKQFLLDIWAFFVSVFGVLGWEIASTWQENKLETAFEKLNK